VNRQTVNSSNIVSIGYNPINRILEIEFKNGVYQYNGISSEIYEKLMNSPSKGKFFYSFIRDKYITKKIV